MSLKSDFKRRESISKRNYGDKWRHEYINIYSHSIIKITQHPATRSQTSNNMVDRSFEKQLNDRVTTTAISIGGLHISLTIRLSDYTPWPVKTHSVVSAFRVRPVPCDPAIGLCTLWEHEFKCSFLKKAKL